MVSGQSFSGGKCHKCGTKMPPMIDEGCWGLVDCPNPECNVVYDTHEYVKKGGGHFNNNGICMCDRCNK